MDGIGGRTAGFLDIYHPVRKIFEEHVKDKAKPRITSTLYEWKADDPLSNVFLAQFGHYPAKEEIGKDYGDFVVVNLRGERVHLKAADPVPDDANRKLTPSALSSWGLDWERRSFWGHPGLYVGDASDFDDLVNFWNLRAADIELTFYDYTQAVRLDALKTAHLEVLAKRPVDGTTARQAM